MATREGVTSGDRRSPVQWAALIFGIGFLAAALAGFVQGGMSMESDPSAAPKALGLFPVNLLHNIVHLVFGVWGLAAARTFAASKSYCTISGAIYLVLTALGFLSPNGFGLVPLGGNDIWLHAVLGIALLGAGLTAKEDRVVVRSA